MIRLKHACRGKEHDPEHGRDAVLVLTYEVQHWIGDTKGKKGTVLTLDVVLRIDEGTREVKTELHILDMPPLADAAAAFAKLGEWCTRLGEELLSATAVPSYGLVPVLLEKNR